MSTNFLLQGATLLGSALVFVLLFRRLGLGAVLGYLVAGMLVGPSGLGVVGDPQSIMRTTEIGIVLLLFLVGLELSPRRLWTMRGSIFVLGPLQVASCGLAMVAVILASMGFTWQAALAIGLPLGLSSTAQVLPLLQSEGRLRSDFGEKSFAILLFQDLSIVPLLTIVAVLSRAPRSVGEPQIGWELALYALLAVAGLVLAGRYLLNPLLRLIGQISSRELFVVAGLFTVAASAGLMQLLGLSPALGSFVAGVMLAESPYRHELEADVDPFRSILLGLFFLSVGMALNLRVVLENPVTVVGLAAALVVVKTGLIAGLGRLFGLPLPRAIVMGLLLSQGGEFGFVLFEAATRAVLIDPAAASLFGAVVTLSMATTPFLMILARRLAQRQRPSSALLSDPIESDDSSVIVVGHGRFGQTVAEIMQGAGRAVTMIDIKPDQIELSGEFGRKVFYGDGTRVDLLHRAGADEAEAILFCHDDPDFGAKEIGAIQASFPHAALFARAYDRRHSLRLQPAEGVRIRREVHESAVALATDALDRFRLSRRSIERIITEYRRRDLARMEAQRESGDMHAGAELSFGGAESRPFKPEGAGP